MSQATTDSTAVQAIGSFAHSFRYEDLVPADQTRVKIRLLNLVGSVFAAHRHPATQLGQAYAQRVASSGPSSFWLSEAKGSIEDCAFVNTVLSHSALLDDTVTHMSCVLVPPAMAVAESRNRTGTEVLAALAVGYEVTARIEAGYGFPSAVMAQGFRHSWPAVFGAATATSSLMGLPADGIADTLALTTTLCVPGTMAWFATWPNPQEKERIGEWGTSERFVQLAANSKNAVLAASLADTGFHGISEAFEADCGLFSVYTGTKGLPPELLAGLGDEWHLAEIGAKAYPGSQILPLYCAEILLEQNELNYEEIDRIEVRSITWKRNIAIVNPGPFTNAEQALMSSPFGIASMLIFGRFDMEILSQALGDARIDALAQRIHFEAVDGSSTPGGKFAEMVVWLKDGSCLTAEASGMPTERLKPDTWEVMVSRFHTMTPGLSGEKRDQIVQEVWEMDKRPNVDMLIASMRSLSL